MSSRLQQYGWNDRFAAAFAEHAAPGRVPARVVLEHTHIYRVATEEGEMLARVSGRLRHRAEARAAFPAVGDWLVLEPVADSDARIHAVLPRFSRFSRRAAGDVTEEQVVAANIDTVFLVGGLDHDFNPRRLERYLVVAWESGATPVIVLNKADLVDDPDRFVDDVASVAPGASVHAVSTRRPESLDVLRTYLGVGRTAALLGSSGVGKSTIVNRLVGYDLLRTQDVRMTDSRGRHTSTARQMVLLEDGGILIDTPGMRELQLWESDEGMETAFADVTELMTKCRFRDCSHEREPGCAIQAALADGSLDRSRWDSYLKLQREQRALEIRLDKRLQADERKKRRAFARQQRRPKKN